MLICKLALWALIFYTLESLFFFCLKFLISLFDAGGCEDSLCVVAFCDKVDGH